MSGFNKRGKQQVVNPRSMKSTSSSSGRSKASARRSEPVSESDSRSEKPFVKGRSRRCSRTSTSNRKQSASSSPSPAQKPRSNRQTTSEDVKSAFKSSDHETSSSSSEATIPVLKQPVAPPLLHRHPSQEEDSITIPRKPIRMKMERSLIGLDGETDYDDEKLSREIASKPSSALSSPKGSKSTEESSATETKDSISLADDEEVTSLYKRRFKELAAKSNRQTLEDYNSDFRTLPTDPPPDECLAFHSPLNSKKNRYFNIPCLDVSRIILKFLTNKNIPGHEYIHANYIKSPFLKSGYILTQGPKKETIGDFWRMVWQEKSSAIVMLCQFVETNKEKCAEYFPRNANCTLRFFDSLVVSHEESTVNKSLVTTRLKLHFEGESHSVIHLQWKEWPDYQVPGSSETILKILRKIRAKHNPVIHCAAGVGRSGTLMATEIALQAINSHHVLPDIRQIVGDLRLSGRACAVQTLQQYMLVWKVILDYGVANKLIGEDQVNKFASTYRRSFLQHNSY